MEYLKKASVRPADEVAERGRRVAEIIQAIRARGDSALVEYNGRFDGNSRTALRVTREEIDAAYAQMTQEELDDLRRAADHIRKFALAQKGCLTELDGFSNVPGSVLGHRVIPVSS